MLFATLSCLGDFTRAAVAVENEIRGGIWTAKHFPLLFFESLGRTARGRRSIMIELKSVMCIA